MELAGLMEYVRSHPDAVVSSLAVDGAPQSAYLDVAVTRSGELVFNARVGSRKIANLERDPRVSLVIGGRDGTTLQCEGVADRPQGDDRERCARSYAESFPQFAGSAEDAGVVLVRVRLTWARFGDYRARPSTVVEVDLGTFG